ncbi:unnamed protein product [Pseudo-nitzschia multistriata]|uniref:FAD-binding FR-type domain-containing protein n=1 Tax=Pseudo-nitzschia multistriata TaxID=183589 RepID=A0A448ZGV7_9STRA|nr:unnamed protein product [Pseudo-nitzschia multistriata]
MFHAGRIAGRSRISPTVVKLDITVTTPPLASFLPGQWVDLVAEGQPWVGGFSIASSPRDLPTLTLAVKRSGDPPAAWVHDADRSAVGSPVRVRVGGGSVLTGPGPLRPSVFCAGGIGIAPVLSQYREFLFLRGAAAEGSPAAPAMLLYTASRAEELVFGGELADLSREGCTAGGGSDRVVFALTREPTGWGSERNGDSDSDRTFPPHVELRTGRVLKEFLDEGPADADYYLCGPPSMIDEAVAHLRGVRSIPHEQIKYEKWW